MIATFASALMAMSPGGDADKTMSILEAEFQTRLKSYAACYSEVLRQYHPSGMCAVTWHTMTGCEAESGAVSATREKMVRKGGESDWMLWSQAKVLDDHWENINRSFGFPAKAEGTAASCIK